MTGDHRGRGLGEGLELDRLRPYEPGDDVRRIDWNATARSLIPQVREDVPDRQLTAWLLLDQSASMQFGTADRRKADVAEGAALVIGRFVARRDRSTRRHHLRRRRARRRSRRPRAAASGCTGLLRALDAEPPERGRWPDIGAAGALRIVAADAHAPGLVAIVSDFRGPLDWRRAMTAIAGRHTVLADRDHRPARGDPRGCRRADADRPRDRAQTVRVDTGDRRLRIRFDDAAAAERAALATEFARLGVRHLRLSTDGAWLTAMARGLDTDGTYRMTFLAPILLLGLLLVPVLVGLYLLVQRRRTRYAVRFTNLDLLANLAPRRPVLAPPRAARRSTSPPSRSS